MSTPHVHTSAKPSGWVPHDGVALLRTLAGGLIELAKQTGLEAFTMPYPAEAQRALDRTVLACLLRGAAPPQSMAELIDWCATRPLSDWPLNLPPDAVAADDLLLDEQSRQPTELCHEWAERSRDAGAEHLDRQVIQAALRLCQEYGQEETYSAFRDLLVNRPVLTSAEAFEVSADLLMEPVRELISWIYEEVPASYLADDGAYATCGRCLTLLTPTRDGAWWCERDRCRRQGPPPIGRRLYPEEVGEVLQLQRPLRQFVTGPGRAEMDLARALRALGLTVRMWPGFDSYDLRVTFPSGRVWAIDVKDWASPRLLGQAARPVRRQPPYDEAFWVVPRHRVADRPGYIETFERNRPLEAGGIRLLTDEDVERLARARLRSSHTDPNPGGSDA
jgi:hypothetical protein